MRFVERVRAVAYLVIASALLVPSVFSLAQDNDSPSPIRREMNEVHRQIVDLQTHQLELLEEIPQMKEKLDNLTKLADRREAMIDLLMVGVAALVLEMAVRAIIAGREKKKTS